jgi:hypothetical protein
MSSPAVKDLPTIANGLKGELEKDHQLKKTSVSSPYTQLFCNIETWKKGPSLILPSSIAIICKWREIFQPVRIIGRVV